MKLLSIDIGIKNLAICSMEIKDDVFDILQWEVVNLCNPIPVCQCVIKNKKQNKVCNKKATYEKDGQFYCKTHAKKTKYLLPEEQPNIKKLKLTELVHLANTYSLEVNKKKKNEVLEIITSYVSKNKLNLVSNTKATDLTLVEIGIAINNKLSQILKFNDIDRIIIENQLSPLASRMKTIQGMVAQYFIMNNKTDVIFISAINKLKPFVEKKLSYKERKEYSTKITKNIITHVNNKWNILFEKHTKKDDLADSLLQGLSYACKNNFIKKDLIENVKIDN